MFPKICGEHTNLGEALIPSPQLETVIENGFLPSKRTECLSLHISWYLHSLRVQICWATMAVKDGLAKLVN